MKQRIVVLDIDGTLTDSIALHQHAFGAAMAALGLPSLNTDWSSYPSHTDIGIYQHALQENGRPLDAHAQHVFEADVEHRFMTLLANTPVHEIRGATDFLAALDRTDWAVVFATGGIRGVSGKKLDALGVAYDASMLVTSSEYAARDELVAAAIMRAKQKYALATPLAVVSVGDGRWDLEVAATLGVDFLGVGAGTSAHWLRAQGATVIPDLTGGLEALSSFLDGPLHLHA